MVTVKSETISAEFITEGKTRGKAIVTETSLCFWGGLDAKTGKIIDPKHPLLGEDISNKVLVFPKGHGSSSSSSVLLEAMRAGNGPLAIINISCEPIIAIGSIIAEVLYNTKLPIATVSENDFYKIGSGNLLSIDSEEQLIRIEK